MLTKLLGGKMKILKKAALIEKTKPKDFERNSKAKIKVR